MSRWFEDVKRQLEQYGYEEAIKRLFPSAIREGSYYKMANVQGDLGNSLKVSIQNGGWKDYATGQSGDFISLWFEHKCFSRPKEAVEDLVKVLGLKLPEAFISSKKKKRVPVWPVPETAPAMSFKVGQELPRKPNYKLAKIWEYAGADAERLFYVLRFEGIAEDEGKPKKQIRPCCWCGPEEGWQLVGPGSRNIPLYGLPRLKEQPDAAVLVVEGEKAADAAHDRFPEYAVVSWQGGVNSILKADWSLLSGRKVVYWPDADAAGRDSVGAITSVLASAKAGSLTGVQLPSGVPDKWDLADPVPEGIDLQTVLDTAEAVDLYAVLPLDQLSFPQIVGRFYFVTEGEVFADPLTGVTFTPSQFSAFYRHLGGSRPPSLANSFLEQAPSRKVVKMGYRPGEEQRVFDETPGVKALNLWQAPSIEPREGDASKFVDHLRYLCPTDEEFESLADTLAHMVQNPREKLMYALLLIGGQGTGKSYLGSVMKQVLGVANVTDVETKELKSDFNEFMHRAQLVIIHETMTLGRKDVANTLKSLITERHVPLNVKYGRRQVVENHANFIMLSNHPDAVPMEPGDRRYLVIASEAEKRDEAYYDELWRWSRNNGPEILHWLMSRDLSAFSPTKAPIMTEGKKLAIEESKPAWEHDLELAIEGDGHPFTCDLVELEEVYSYYHRAYPHVNRHAVSKAMRKYGAKSLGQHKGLVGGKILQVSLWAVRNVDYWNGIPQSARLAAFMDGATYPSIVNADKANRLF